MAKYFCVCIKAVATLQLLYGGGGCWGKERPRKKRGATVFDIFYICPHTPSFLWPLETICRRNICNCVCPNLLTWRRRVTDNMQTLSFLSSVGGLKKIKDNLLYFFYCLTFVKELSFLFQIHFVKTGQTLHSGNINMNQSKHSYEPINSKAILTQTLSFLVPPSQVWYVEFSIENKVQMVVRVFVFVFVV